LKDTQFAAVKLPKCLEGPHNTYDRSTNSSRLQHRIMGMNLRDHSAVSEKPFWEIASFLE